jgi:hypothetical protein
LSVGKKKALKAYTSGLWNIHYTYWRLKDKSSWRDMEWYDPRKGWARKFRFKCSYAYCLPYAIKHKS